MDVPRLLQCVEVSSECSPRDDVDWIDGECYAFPSVCPPDDPTQLEPRIESRCGSFEQIDGPECGPLCPEIELGFERADGGFSSCAHPIPALPRGFEVDPNAVLIQVRVGGEERVLPQVQTAEVCSVAGNGWRYDDTIVPAQIVLCPDICEALARDNDAVIVFLQGCIARGPPF